MLRVFWDPELLGLDREMYLPSPVHETEGGYLVSCLLLRKRPLVVLLLVLDTWVGESLRQLVAAGRDRPFHRRTALLMEEEARVSHAAWAQSMDACDQKTSETETVSGGTKDSEEPQDLDGSSRQRQQGPCLGSTEPELTEDGPVVAQFLDLWVVMTVATVQSVKYYGLFPASRLYRSFVLSSYSV
ncbi:hypothetical protein Tco_1040975 [Tanacetum coccineum]|uniref:Uncharacterized protein n=1 Tax=Tanacetum coccineum TaxID=301880 RepID=A0ABQ5GGB7_9ASTR